MTDEEWLVRQFEFGFDCGLHGWKNVPVSQPQGEFEARLTPLSNEQRAQREEGDKARLAGFTAGQEASITYSSLAKTKAQEWVKQRSGK